MSELQPYFVVDAFTSRPFAGNPAAVMPLEQWRDDVWLQNVALEMNLSETAFLVENPNGYDLRWFTPAVEVDLCGHATLAAAAVLNHLGKLAEGSEVSFSTRSGNLKAGKIGDRYQLDFPITPAIETAPPPGLIDALKVNPKYVGGNTFDLIVEIASETELRGISPHFKLLATLPCRGVIVTACSDDSQFDFVSRFFAPAAGIDEDPVTGSAHCCLADYWGKKLGKRRMAGYQASRRGGIVYVELHGDRVILGGEAVIVTEGRFFGG